MASAVPDPCPRWHSTQPVVSAYWKTIPEDFVVEELPAYLPTGTGEHLFLWIEKRDVPAERLTQHLARTLGVSPGDIGVAGLKDRRAVTRQWVSVPARAAEALPAVETEGVRVLEAVRHTNKLRTGHLRGNRFTIVIRGLHAAPTPTVTTMETGPSDQPVAMLTDQLRADIAQVAQRIAQSGFPNYFGDQRFGRERSNLDRGRALLAGFQSPKEIPYARRRFLLKMSLSAVQSELFNQVLAARLTDGLLETVLAGDVMEVVASGGKFLAEDVTAEQPRCSAYETVITGPMFGSKMRTPAGVPAEREAAVLQASGLDPARFREFGDLFLGTRRAMLVRPADFCWKWVDEAGPEVALRLQFDLPPGVYATTLLREFGDVGEANGESVNAIPAEAETVDPTDEPVVR